MDTTKLVVGQDVFMRKEDTPVSIVIRKKSTGLFGPDKFGKFRPMTLDEAKALPRNAEFWVLATNGGAFQVALVGVPQTYEKNPNRVTLHCRTMGFTEDAILAGQVLVEVA